MNAPEIVQALAFSVIVVNVKLFGKTRRTSSCFLSHNQRREDRLAQVISLVAQKIHSVAQAEAIHPACLHYLSICNLIPVSSNLNKPVAYGGQLLLI